MREWFRWKATGQCSCRQIHLPHATFSHAQSLHSTDDMCAWRKIVLQTACALGSSLSCISIKVIHPHVMFHLAPHSTLNTSTSSLLFTSLVLQSSTSPTETCCPRIHLGTVKIHGRMALLGNTNPPQIMRHPTRTSKTNNFVRCWRTVN